MKAVLGEVETTGLSNYPPLQIDNSTDPKKDAQWLV